MLPSTLLTFQMAATQPQEDERQAHEMAIVVKGKVVGHVHTIHEIVYLWLEMMREDNR